MKVAFDVDGTLIYQGDAKFQILNPYTNMLEPKDDTPRYEIVQLFHLFKSFGYDMYIWSGGGLDYAMRWMTKLGLEATIVEKGSFKPDIAVDDEHVTLGAVNLKV